MEYEIKIEGHYTILMISGEVDMYYSPRAREQILKHLGENKNLLVDLSGVDYIDSSGVASLVEGLQLAKSSQLEFGLIGVSDAAMQVLQLARLDKVFPIHSTVDERLASSK